MTDNLKLWDSVSTTPKEHTKEYSGRGGFKGNAIKPMYLIHKATELWGPMGGKWRVDIIDEKVYSGAPLIDGSGLAGNEQLHVVKIRLSYPLEDGTIGTIETFGHTLLSGKNTKGFFTDEEAPKKSLTDATGNALSKLGFSADIYMGTFDGDKYQKTEPEREERKPEELKQKVVDATEINKTTDSLKSKINALGKEDIAKVPNLYGQLRSLPDEKYKAAKEMLKAVLKSKLEENGWDFEKKGDVVTFFVKEKKE